MISSFKASLLLILAAATLPIACKKIDQLLTFNISNQSSTTIPSTTPVNLPVNISTPPVQSNSEQQFKNNNSDVKFVKDIRLENMNMTISSPPAQNFGFLKSIHLYISTDTTNEIELAHLDSIPSTATSISLIPTQSALDSYIKSSSYNLRTQVVCRQVISQNMTIDIQLKFKVTANL